MTPAQPTRLSTRLASISESATLAVTARAKALAASGADVVNFGAGEPDFDTPPHIIQAAIHALENGETRYAPAAGSPALRAAVADWMNQWNPCSPYTPARVAVTSGGKFALYAAFSATLNPDDQAIIPAPFWVSMPEFVRLAQATPVILPCPQENQFKLLPDQLAAAITARTRIVCLNSPSNPTGAVYSADELRALLEVIAPHPNVLIFSDEIYEKLVYPPASFTSLASLRPDLTDRILTFSGASKTFAMTGWRIGWVAGPQDLINAIAMIASQSTSNPTTFAMSGALAALRSPLDFLPAWLNAYQRRAALMTSLLNQMPGVECLPPAGAFYCFPRVRGLFGRTIAGKTIHSSFELCTALLETAHVALVPGEPFGADDHVRLSFACSEESIQKGLSRMAQLLDPARSA